MNEPIRRMTDEEAQLYVIRDLVLNLYEKVTHGTDCTIIIDDLIEILTVLDGEEELP